MYKTYIRSILTYAICAGYLIIPDAEETAGLSKTLKLTSNRRLQKNAPVFYCDKSCSSARTQEKIMPLVVDPSQETLKVLIH